MLGSILVIGYKNNSKRIHLKELQNTAEWNLSRHKFCSDLVLGMYEIDTNAFLRCIRCVIVLYRTKFYCNSFEGSNLCLIRSIQISELANPRKTFLGSTHRCAAANVCFLKDHIKIVGKQNGYKESKMDIQNCEFEQKKKRILFKKNTT